MTNRNGVWRSLELWRASAFLLAGIILAINAVIVAAEMVVGVERWRVLGQIFVGAGWTAAFIGLLGLYPGLADGSRWLARAGALFAAIGAVVFTVMGLASFVFYAGIVDGSLTTLVPLFLPGVIIGSILGFVSISAASLRVDVHSRTLGLLLLLPPTMVILNLLTAIVGIESAMSTLAVVIGDTLAMLAIGMSVRGSDPSTDYTEAESSSDLGV